MKYKYQFEYEFRKIIDFIKARKERNDEELLTNVYKMIAFKKKNESVSEEEAFIDSIINNNGASVVEIALAYYMSTPINFSFKWITDNIKSYADFYNLNIDIPKIDSYESFKSYVFSIHGELLKTNLSKAIYHSVIKALEDGERRIKQLIQIPNDVIDTLETYCNFLSKYLLVPNDMINKIINIIEKEKLIDIEKLEGFESNKQYIDEFKSYTKNHNQNVMIDLGIKELAEKEKPFGIIEWNDDYDMEDFVDVYWNRMQTYSADLIKYMLPQNDFPRYDEFLNQLISRFDENMLKDDSSNKKYNVLKDISIKR